MPLSCAFSMLWYIRENRYRFFNQAGRLDQQRGQIYRIGCSLQQHHFARSLTGHTLLHIPLLLKPMEPPKPVPGIIWRSNSNRHTRLCLPQTSTISHRSKAAPRPATDTKSFQANEVFPKACIYMQLEATTSEQGGEEDVEEEEEENAVVGSPDMRLVPTDSATGRSPSQAWGLAISSLPRNWLAFVCQRVGLMCSQGLLSFLLSLLQGPQDHSDSKARCLAALRIVQSKA
jgi:hypothetical protein